MRARTQSQVLVLNGNLPGDHPAIISMPETGNGISVVQAT
jgi:hypothetical protein